MIKVRVSNNVDSCTRIIDENTTLLKAISDANFDPTRTGVKWYLNGTCDGVDLNKTFKQFGVVDSCELSQINDQKNA